MGNALRLFTAGIAVVLVAVAPAESRTIRVDRQFATIPGTALANDGSVEANIVSVQEVPPNGEREMRPFSINFFGTVYNSLFINENGVISFGAPLSAAPRNIADIFHAGVPVIVPYFADADMAVGGRVNRTFTFGVNTFLDMYATYQGSTDPAFRNEMQVAFFGSETSTDFRLELNYNNILWESGDLDGGTNGLGGIAPRVGFSDGFGRVYEVAGSGENGLLLGRNADCLPGSLSLACNDYFFSFINGMPYLNGVPIFPNRVPEPMPVTLLLTGLAFLAMLRRRSGQR
jgi:hypothetical protein